MIVFINKNIYSGMLLLSGIVMSQNHHHHSAITHTGVVVGASAMTGVITLTMYYPLDVVMSMMQLQKSTINGAVRTVWQRHGFRGYYAGMSRWIVASAVQRMAFMGSYEVALRQLNHLSPEGGIVNQLSAGVFSALVDSAVAYYPDMNKTFAIKGVSMASLPWSVHFRACQVMLLKNAPANVALLLGRDFFSRYFSEKGVGAANGAAIAGFTFGVASQLIVAPLDTIKTNYYGALADQHQQATLPKLRDTIAAVTQNQQLFNWRVMAMRMLMKGLGTATGFYLLSEFMRIGFQQFEPGQHTETAGTTVSPFALFVSSESSEDETVLEFPQRITNRQ